MPILLAVHVILGLSFVVGLVSTGLDRHSKHMDPE